LSSFAAWPRYRISHAAFCVAFPLGLFAACNAPNLGKFAGWFARGEGTDVAGLGAYLLAGLGLFIAFFTLLAHRRTIKPLAILFAVLGGAATYFISKYGVAVDTSMILNVVHTDPTEVKQLLSWRMWPYVVVLMVVPAAAVLAAEVTFRPGARYLVASAAIFTFALAVALAALYLNYNSVIRAGNVSKKYIVYSLVPVNLISAGLNAAWKSARPWLASRDAPEIRGRVASDADLVVVLAIGESSRSRNFSLYGYDRRQTTPVLGQVDGLHVLDGVARQGSTLNALPEILEKSGIRLTEIASKLGIPTACYVNYTLYDNCEPPGEVKATRCAHGGTCYDEDVIPLLEANLRVYRHGKRLVVLHLGGGSHGPVYSDRYPPEFRKFRPMCNDADVANACTLEQLYNSYDNTILYVDHVLGGILQALDASGGPYVFLYLSDHGESLMDEGRMFHGMPPGMQLPPEQAQVPLIVKASMPVSIVPRAEYTQPEVYDTVLDLLSIASPDFDRAGSFIIAPAG
jgi:lipid A ethanolaminephosphotransferase